MENVAFNDLAVGYVVRLYSLDNVAGILLTVVEIQPGDSIRLTPRDTDGDVYLHYKNEPAFRQVQWKLDIVSYGEPQARLVPDTTSMADRLVTELRSTGATLAEARRVRDRFVALYDNIDRAAEPTTRKMTDMGNDNGAVIKILTGSAAVDTIKVSNTAKITFIRHFDDSYSDSTDIQQRRIHKLQVPDADAMDEIEVQRMRLLGPRSFVDIEFPNDAAEMIDKEMQRNLLSNGSEAPSDVTTVKMQPTLALTNIQESMDKPDPYELADFQGAEIPTTELMISRRSEMLRIAGCAILPGLFNELLRAREVSTPMQRRVKLARLEDFRADLVSYKMKESGVTILHDAEPYLRKMYQRPESSINLNDIQFSDDLELKMDMADILDLSPADEDLPVALQGERPGTLVDYISRFAHLGIRLEHLTERRAKRAREVIKHLHASSSEDADDEQRTKRLCKSVLQNPPPVSEALRSTIQFLYSFSGPHMNQNEIYRLQSMLTEINRSAHNLPTEPIVALFRLHSHLKGLTKISQATSGVIVASNSITNILEHGKTWGENMPLLVKTYKTEQDLDKDNNITLTQTAQDVSWDEDFIRQYTAHDLLRDIVRDGRTEEELKGLAEQQMQSSIYKDLSPVRKQDFIQVFATSAREVRVGEFALVQRSRAYYVRAQTGQVRTWTKADRPPDLTEWNNLRQTFAYRPRLQSIHAGNKTDLLDLLGELETSIAKARRVWNSTSPSAARAEPEPWLVKRSIYADLVEDIVHQRDWKTLSDNFASWFRIRETPSDPRWLYCKNDIDIQLLPKSIMDYAELYVRAGGDNARGNEEANAFLYSEHFYNDFNGFFCKLTNYKISGPLRSVEESDLHQLLDEHTNAPAEKSLLVVMFELFMTTFQDLLSDAHLNESEIKAKLNNPSSELRQGILNFVELNYVKFTTVDPLFVKDRFIGPFFAIMLILKFLRRQYGSQMMQLLQKITNAREQVLDSADMQKITKFFLDGAADKIREFVNQLESSFQFQTYVVNGARGSFRPMPPSLPAQTLDAADANARAVGAINELVRKERKLFATRHNVQFIQNACCLQKEIQNPIDYFKTKLSSAAATADPAAAAALASVGAREPRVPERTYPKQRPSIMCRTPVAQLALPESRTAAVRRPEQPARRAPGEPAACFDIENWSALSGAERAAALGQNIHRLLTAAAVNDPAINLNRDSNLISVRIAEMMRMLDDDMTNDVRRAAFVTFVTSTIVCLPFEKGEGEGRTETTSKAVRKDANRFARVLLAQNEVPASRRGAEVSFVNEKRAFKSLTGADTAPLKFAMAKWVWFKYLRSIDRLDEGKAVDLVNLNLDVVSMNLAEIDQSLEATLRQQNRNVVRRFDVIMNAEERKIFKYGGSDTQFALTSML